MWGKFTSIQGGIRTLKKRIDRTSWNTPVVLSQGLEQVLAQLVHLQSLAHAADAIELDVAENFQFRPQFVNITL